MFGSMSSSFSGLLSGPNNSSMKGGFYLDEVSKDSESPRSLNHSARHIGAKHTYNVKHTVVWEEVR